ncbi:MAG: hypothetical protein JNM78_06100 [Cyclobacteriaceae bacterium]|nr:hypothetical protein [Cyclobacteriaceae bacterium]
MKTENENPASKKEEQKEPDTKRPARSRNQQRLFEKMGMVIKVSRPPEK